jgi:hypothetical protein
MLLRMAKVRVPLWQQPNKYAVLDPSPAIVGVNVFLPDGSLFQPPAPVAPSSPPGPPSVGGVPVVVWSTIQDVPANIRAVEALTGTGVVVRESGGALETMDLVRQSAAALSSSRAVSVALDGRVAYPDRTLTDDAMRFIGILMTSASAADESVTVRRQGRVSELAWSWTPGPVWVGDSGVLTQTPPASGWLLRVGTAINATTIDIEPEPPIL